MKRHQLDELEKMQPVSQEYKSDDFGAPMIEDESRVTAPAQDSHTRSMLKGLTWRMVASLTTITISWYITGQVQTALEIGFIEFFMKIAIYYAHERLWANARCV